MNYELKIMNYHELSSDCLFSSPLGRSGEACSPLPFGEGLGVRLLPSFGGVWGGCPYLGWLVSFGKN